MTDIVTLSTQLTEDRLRHASGPVQPSVPLHLFLNFNLYETEKI